MRIRFLRRPSGLIIDALPPEEPIQRGDPPLLGVRLRGPRLEPRFELLGRFHGQWLWTEPALESPSVPVVQLEGRIRDRALGLCPDERLEVHPGLPPVRREN